MNSAVSTTTETAIPTTGTWTIDPAHTLAEFAVKHLMITTVKGRFTGISGAVTLDPADPARPHVDVTMDVASISTGDQKRDAHLRSADFFEVETWPSLHFVGTRIEGDVDSHFTLYGRLTIRGITRDLALDVTNEGRATDPWGNQKIGFTATGRLNRLDYGLKWNLGLEAGGVTVGDEVKLLIEAQLVRQG